MIRRVINNEVSLITLANECCVNKDIAKQHLVLGYNLNRDARLPYLDLEGKYKIYVLPNGFVGRQNGYNYINCERSIDIISYAKGIPTEDLTLVIKLGLLSAIRNLDEYDKFMGLDLSELKPGLSHSLGRLVKSPGNVMVRLSDSDLKIIEAFAEALVEYYAEEGNIALNHSDTLETYYRQEGDRIFVNVDLQDCPVEIELSSKCKPFVAQIHNIAFDALDCLLCGTQLKDSSCVTGSLKSLQDLEPKELV